MKGESGRARRLAYRGARVVAIVSREDFATITSPHGLVEARVLVTPRMRPITVEGRTVHQIGLPYHWGYKGIVRGDVTNDLLAISQEPNVRIMETKALVCNVEAKPSF